jgi:hypothetical protein
LLLLSVSGFNSPIISARCWFLRFNNYGGQQNNAPLMLLFTFVHFINRKEFVMRELYAEEVKLVDGGFMPAIQAVVYGLGMLASNPAVRTGLTWAAQGVVGGAAWAMTQEVFGES